MWSLATVDRAAGDEEKIALLPTAAGAAPRLIAFQRQRATGFIRFSRDGKSLIYTVRENGVDNLWQHPLYGSAGKPLTSFKAEYIWDFHWSPDGNKLAIVRWHPDSAVVLMRDMQQKDGH